MYVSESEKGLWTLPPSMSSYRRRLLHAIADEEGLAHVSTGWHIYHKTDYIAGLIEWIDIRPGSSSWTQKTKHEVCADRVIDILCAKTWVDATWNNIRLLSLCSRGIMDIGGGMCERAGPHQLHVSVLGLFIVVFVGTLAAWVDVPGNGNGSID